ncbi:hypothetical protein AaE_013521, partial [Aphanomyces astaci]
MEWSPPSEDEATRHLHAAFPSLQFTTDEDDDADCDVDISVDDIRLPSVKDAIQQSIDGALAKWEELLPISTMEVLRVTQQRAATQKIARLVLKDEPTTDVTDQKIQGIFRDLVTEDECLAARRPCPLVQQFLDAHPHTRKGPLIEHPPIPGWMFAAKSAAGMQESPVDLLHDSLYLLEVMHSSLASKKSQFLLVLGSTPLTALADAIYCRDYEYLKEFGLHSKMMYMAGQFFVDKRQPHHVDYSNDVRQWLQKFPALQLDYPGYDTTSMSMERATLSALALQLDTPYLFLHLGQCEHIMFIRNIRLLHTMDDPRTDEYPMRLTRRQHHQKCL